LDLNLPKKDQNLHFYQPKSYLLGLVAALLPGLKALTAPRLKTRVIRVLIGAIVELQMSENVVDRVRVREITEGLRAATKT
jgi:hypothetical protein